MDTIIALAIAAIVGMFFVRGYLKSLKKQEKKAREAVAKGAVFSEGPKSQHPHIDTAMVHWLRRVYRRVSGG